MIPATPATMFLFVIEWMGELRALKWKTMVMCVRIEEEDLLATAEQGSGFFVTSPGAILHDRYRVVRKLGRGRVSSTFLVEDLHIK